MFSLNSAHLQRTRLGRRSNGARGGFTLVEVMVATVLLSMIILGILSVLIGSYRVAAKARYADHARYVIKSYADQFLTQQPLDSNGNTILLFQPTVDPNTGNLTPLGTGLDKGFPGTPSTDPLTLYYYVQLGDNSGAPVTASVTRTVQWVYSSTGAPTLINQSESAGYLLVGVFTITYPFLGQNLSESISVVRSVP